MSIAQREVASVWNTGLRTDRCKSPTLVEYLSDLGVLSRTYEVDDETDEIDPGLKLRDEQRVRILKRLSAAPEGLMLKTIVSEVIKGQVPGQCERFDGSDGDYKIAYRFLNHLAALDPPLVEKRKTGYGLEYTPTFRLLDLISEGISQTVNSEERGLYDKQFCEMYLKRAHAVDERGRDLLEDSLHRYMTRIEDYRLLFDVTLLGREGRGSSSRRMTKAYKTRFNSQGRIRKQWARFNDALEHAYDRYDNAVLMTLTTDPGTFDDDTRPDPRALWEGIETINPNFNRLLSFMDSDPVTIPDARLEHTPDYPNATGRPRYRPPYLKALEFTEKGYPHLHVLMFDVPVRESDGMPYLIDKQELSDKWKDYGQGQIVDLYPLVYRDDLEEVGGFADDVTEGFVDWYRYGDHGFTKEEIEERARSHDLINFDEETTARTAGAYLGKYLSATFGALLETADGEDPSREVSYKDKSATWKLGLYWATGKRFWSVSKDIEGSIALEDHTQDPDVRQAVREWSISSIATAARPAVLDDLARRSWSDLDDLGAAVADVLDDVVLPSIESTLPESSEFYAHIRYLGCYSFWDLPTADATAPSVEAVEDFVPRDDPGAGAIGAANPPPILDVWGDSAATT